MAKLGCLIIRQPYSSLIAFGKKRWEFRSYDTRKRGVIGIAASHRKPWLTKSTKLNSVLHFMPRGVVLATAELKESFFATSDDLKRNRGQPTSVNLHGNELVTLGEPIGEPPEDVDEAIQNQEWESFVWLLDSVKQLEIPIPIEKYSGSTWINVAFPEE